MKKIIFIAILLIPSYALALGAGFVGLSAGASGSAAETCGDASGLVVYWSCEHTTITSGTPAGCTTGADKAWAAGSSAALDNGIVKVGTYSCDFPSASDFYYLDVTSAPDSTNYNEGTVDFWLYAETILDAATIVVPLKVAANTNNYIRVSFYGTTNVVLYHTAGGITRSINTSIPSGLQASTWYHIIAKWSASKSDGTNYLQICADTTTGTTNCGNGTTALGTWEEGAGYIYTGERNGVATDFHIDEFKIYNKWK